MTKPEKLVRLFDIIIQNATDLFDLATSGRDRKAEEEAFAEEPEVKSQGFQAERCFYVAKSYSVAGKRTKAYALYSGALEHADSAIQSYQRLKGSYVSAVQELKELSNHCRMQRSLEHAMKVAKVGKIQDKVSKRVSAITLKDAEKKVSTKYLLDILDSYESAVGSVEAKETPHIVKFPPPFQAVPCKPIVLDTAINAIKFPSLEGRMKKEEKKSIFGRWWR